MRHMASVLRTLPKAGELPTIAKPALVAYGPVLIAPTHGPLIVCLAATRLTQCRIQAQNEDSEDKRGNVVRFAMLMSVVLLAACADQSKGSVLNECQTKYYLEDPGAQEQLIPSCMKAASFDMVAECSPAPDERQWDWQVQSFPFHNPKCYRPVGSVPWIATVLSPM